MSARIVITGLGFVCPLGTGAGPVWDAWSAGESGVRRLADDDPRLARGVDPVALPEIGQAGFVRGFEPREHIHSSHLRRMDWCSRMIVASATQAVTDAGVRLDDETAQRRTALVVGSSYGNQRETQQYMARVLKNGPAAGQPILFPNLVLNAAGGYTAIELSVRGPNLSVSAHEASGEIAVVTAVDLLRARRCDRVIVAGADEFGAIYIEALRERRLLDGTSSPAPARGNASRGRIVPGEGAAALVLEREPDALARESAPYASIGVAYSAGVPAGPYDSPDPDAAVARLLRLIEEADGSRRSISAVIGGANGARPREELDRALLAALADRQGRSPAYVRIDGLVGDWGARGVLAAALAALAVHRGRLPGATQAPCTLERVLIPGSARSGIVVPIAIDR